MKKIIATILIMALLAVSASAIAEEGIQESQQDSQIQEQIQNDTTQKTKDRHQRTQRTKTEQNDVTDAISSATQVPDPSDDSQSNDTSPSERNPQDGKTKSRQRPATDQKTDKQPKTGKGKKHKNGSASTVLDLETLVKQGVISQETADQIKAYLEEHPVTETPADVPALLKALLEAEIITLDEYDTLFALQASSAS